MKYVHLPIRAVVILCLLCASAVLAAPTTEGQALTAVKYAQTVLQETGDELGRVESEIQYVYRQMGHIDEAMRQRDADRVVIENMLLEVRACVDWVMNDLGACDHECYRVQCMLVELEVLGLKRFKSKELLIEIDKAFDLHDDLVQRIADNTGQCERLEIAIAWLFREFYADE